MVTWMEGDDGRRGRVRRGVLRPETLGKNRSPLALEERVDVSPEGGNHRDPEIAAAGSRIYLVWSDFTRDKTGVPVLQTLVCP